MMKQVMVKAVAMAKKMEGDWIARMALALKAAWAMVKKETKATMQEVAEMLKKRVSGVQVNVWERYGKRRIYVNKGFRNNVAMLEFDQDDNIIGDIELDAMDILGATQAGWEDELIAVYDVVGEVA